MNIKEARAKHGLSQQQLANMTGIPKRSIENWDGGQRKCPEYVERMVVEYLEQQDYKTILEEIRDMIASDLDHLTGAAKQYANNLLAEIEDSMK